jgi:glycine oxidase
LSNPTRSFDVAVVGGGVIGLAVAWRAAARGLRVTVLERGEPGAGTSRVAAGMIAPISEARRSEQPLLRLGLTSARSYPEFVAELIDTTGHDPGYLACGTIAAARDSDEAQALDRELALRQSLGLPVRRLLASEARRLEPSLAPALRLGLEVPDDHAIDPRKLTAALAEAARRTGVELRPGVEVAELALTSGGGERDREDGERDREDGERDREDGGRVDGVKLRTGEVVNAEQVVVAAGVWCGSLQGIPADARVPIRPVKGQILRLHDPAGPGLLSRALRMHAGYVVPRGDGRYVLGATTEERGFDTTVTAGPVFELLRDAIELLPGFSELVIDEVSAGLRPSTPDNAPALGPGAIDGLHWATGHYRHGILLAPVTADIVSAAVAKDPLPELAAAFTPARFAAAATVAVGA